MALVTGKSLIKATVKWSDLKANTGFSSTEQGDTLEFSLSPAVATYNHVFVRTYTIAAAGTQLVDFYGPWTNLVGESVTATKILGFWMSVTGNGTLTVKPDATDGLLWPLANASDIISLIPSTGTAIWAFCNGTHGVVSNTAKEWLLTAATAELTVKLVAFCGT